MDSLKSFVKQNLQLILLVLCGILVLTGILVFVLGAADSEGSLKVMLIVFGVVIEALAISLALMAAVCGSAEKANFFLYDPKLKSNISVDDLSFDDVDKKMTFVMANLTSSASKVWTENVFDSDNEIFETDDYVPLVAYKILYDLTERAGKAVWSLYLMADDSIIAPITSALELNGDGELAKAFKFLHDSADGDYQRTAKFLNDNKKYIQVKMLKYVKTNIDKF